MKYVIVKYAKKTVHHNYLPFNPERGVFEINSCYSTLPNEHKNIIKQIYEENEKHIASVDCKTLNELHPTGNYEVCSVIEPPIHRVGFVSNYIVEIGSGIEKIILDTERVYKSLEELIDSDYLLSNVKEYIDYQKEIRIEDIKLDRVLLEPTIFNYVFNLIFDFKLSNYDRIKFSLKNLYINSDSLHIRTIEMYNKCTDRRVIEFAHEYIKPFIDKINEPL